MPRQDDVVASLRGEGSVDLSRFPHPPPAIIGPVQRAGYEAAAPASVVVTALFIAGVVGAAALFGGGELYHLLGLGRSDAMEVFYAASTVAVLTLGAAVFALRGNLKPDGARFLGTNGFARVCHRSRGSYVVLFRDVVEVRCRATRRKARITRDFRFIGRDGTELAHETGLQFLKVWAAKPEVASESAVHAFASTAAQTCARVGARLS